MRRVLVLTVALGVMFALAAPAGAAGRGAIQVRALGEALGPCGLGSDFDITITPRSTGWSLDGCLGQTFGPGHDNGAPSGVYLERGTEVFDGCLVRNLVPQECGTFATTYLFTSKWDPDISTGVEVLGRCQHPIVRGSGTGDFLGATGRLDFKDDIDAGNFPMRGHIRLANGA